MNKKESMATEEDKKVTESIAEREEVTSEKSNGEAVKKPKPMIYVGPSFKGVAHGTVYSNGLPPALEEAAKETPAIRELIIPIADVVKATKELAKPDSAMKRFYLAVKTSRKGE